MSSPRISVIVCNYNYANYLGEALASILGQTYRNIECIVVDDGSTDDSLERLRAYDGRVRVIAQPNAGVSAARNRGIEATEGDLVAFLDADDIWHPHKLERQVELLADDSVGMVYTGLLYVDEQGRPLQTILDGERGRVLVEMARLRGPGVPASGSSALVRRTALDRVGGFDEELSTSADWDMWRRIACHYEIERVAEPLVSYRQHARAMHHDVERLERDMLRAFETMFADVHAASVHPLKRECYGNLYLTLSASYLRARRWGHAFRCLGAGASVWPRGLSHVLRSPSRKLFRRAV